MLGGEELAPQRVQMLQCLASFGLDCIPVLRPRCLSRPLHDFGLAEHGTKLLDDGRLDLTLGHPPDRTGSGAMLQCIAAMLAGVVSSPCRNLQFLPITSSRSYPVKSENAWFVKTIGLSGRVGSVIHSGNRA